MYIHDSNNLISQHRTARDYVILSFDGGVAALSSKCESNNKMCFQPALPDC